MYLWSQNKTHVQTSFLNEKGPSSAKIFISLQYAYIFISDERCQRVKKGENQSTLIHPVTPKAARAKAPSHHLCPGTSSPAWCVCKSQKDFLAPTSTWLSNREWWSTFVPLLVLSTFRTGLHTSTYFTQTCESICYNRGFQPLWA